MRQLSASVIIPTSGGSTFLLETLKSLSVQGGGEGGFEIIVVINRSKEEVGTFQQYARIVNNIPIQYVFEPRIGLHHARHAGAKVAQGNILVYTDDDVIVDPGWLNAITMPYQNLKIGMTGGKVLLKWETRPPDWLIAYAGYLSYLDKGESEQPMMIGIGPNGCNMSVRRELLFQVGGFNPDGFSNSKMIYLRGDGEIGLARKIQRAGYLVWYTPKAVVYHRVPEQRITLNYLEWRAALGGIEASYCEFRYQRPSVARVLLRGSRGLLSYIYRQTLFKLRVDKMQEFPKQKITASFNYHKAIHQLHLATSASLRRHVIKEAYLD